MVCAAPGRQAPTGTWKALYAQKGCNILKTWNPKALDHESYQAGREEHFLGGLQTAATKAYLGGAGQAWEELSILPSQFWEEEEEGKACPSSPSPC